MTGIKPPKIGMGTPKISSGTPKINSPTGSGQPGSTALSVANPLKTGQQSTVKMPKAKKLPGPMDKPSVFFKGEMVPKKKGVQALFEFLENVKNKRKIKVK